MIKKFLENNYQIFGTLGVIAGIVMSVAGLEVVLTNLRGDTDIFIQPLALTINGLFWVLFAIGTSNKYVFIPNLVLFLFSLTAFISAFV